jgi:restriction system protein
MTSDSRTWLVRAGKDATFIDDFRANSHIAIGWRETGPILPTASDEFLTDLFDRTFPSAKPGSRRVWQAQVRRFLTEMRPGDPVATYDPNTRVYLLGTVKGNVEWCAGPLPRVRAVQWTHQVLRDALSVSTRNSLGSIATFFRASEDASDELWAKAVPLNAEAEDALPPPPATVAQDESRQTTAETILREEVREKAEQFIEDRIASLDWQQMQELVAGILRAMGYHATVAASGSDRGVDIFASPDGLGLQEPRIFVEVKHRTGAMGADELRSFLGGRRTGDRCLYVSTGGFTKEARYEADRANIPLTLVTLPKLRELLLQHYERLDPAARALVPLQRLYWPVE